jgi:cell division protein FtsW
VEQARRNLVLIILFILAFGLLMLNSAGLPVAKYRYGDSLYFLRSQALRIVLGLLLMLVVSRIDYRRYRPVAKPLLLFSAVLLLIPLLPFTRSITPLMRHVRRWIVFPFTFQPSEVAKFALVLWGAVTILNKGSKIREFRDGVLPLFIVMTMIVVLVVLEPDLSTAILCFSISILLLFLGGARVHHIALCCVIFLLGSLWVIHLTGYQLERIMAMLNPSEGLLKGNYQRHQAMIALGSGGTFGRGIGNGLQKYFFLPESHTDSIFAVIGEELGLVGTVGVLLLFALLGFYGYKIMSMCPDPFGFLLVGGILSMVMIPVILSAAINVGLLPSAGVGLPFISYGGSSMVTLLGSIGVIINVARKGKGRGMMERRT